MSLISRMLAPFRKKAASGYFLQQGWLPSGSAMNWWQMGQKLQPYSSQSAMVEACIGAYSQTVAMCPGDHWRLLPNGGRERVDNSALARILRYPNDYQSISDFLLNLTRSLYFDGNAYAYAVRNDRFEISELHLMDPRASYARIYEGEIFYALGGNDIVESRFGSLASVPARDVLHVRLHTPRDPLRGDTPIMAAALSVAAGNAALQQQVAFFTNEARPSIMLTTDQKLTAPQMEQLRSAWDARTKGDNAGGTPILSAGMKPITVSTTAQDAQLAETMKMSNEAVALAYRVPMQVLGIVDSQSFASTEMLMGAWKASGLGFALNHIEESFGRLFRLRGMPFEYVEFDTNALMRSSFKERIDALSNGTRRVFTINEARALEGLPAVDGGDEIRVQQQDVPLSAWERGQQAAPAAPAPPADIEDDPEEEPVDAERNAESILGRLYDHASLH